PLSLLFPPHTTPALFTLSLHDALPICHISRENRPRACHPLNNATFLICRDKKRNRRILVHSNILQSIRQGMNLIRIERHGNIVSPIKIDDTAYVVFFNYLLKMLSSSVVLHVLILVMGVCWCLSVYMNNVQLTYFFFGCHTFDFLAEPVIGYLLGFDRYVRIGHSIHWEKQQKYKRYH